MTRNQLLGAVASFLAVSVMLWGMALGPAYLSSATSRDTSQIQVWPAVQGRVQTITNGCLSAASVQTGQAVHEEPCAHSLNWIVQTVASGWIKLQAAGSHNCLSPGDALSNAIVLDPCSSPATTLFDGWTKDDSDILTFVVIANSGHGGVLTWQGLGRQLVYEVPHRHALDQLMRLP